MTLQGLRELVGPAPVVSDENLRALYFAKLSQNFGPLVVLAARDAWEIEKKRGEELEKAILKALKED